MDAKVYVGGLPSDATQQELAEAFDSYGKIRKVWVARRPPGFAFIEFDDPRDAEDAVRGLDGTRICGVRARVELSHGRRRGGQYGGYDRRRSRSRSPSRTRSRATALLSPLRGDSWQRASLRYLPLHGDARLRVVRALAVARRHREARIARGVRLAAPPAARCVIAVVPAPVQARADVFKGAEGVPNSSYNNNMREGKVYVGGLPHDATSEELEGAFSRYGRLKKVWVARRPPGFAFVEFEDIRDAEDAVRALNGQRICGVRARVELSTGYRRSEGSRGGGHGNNADRNNGFMRAYNDRYERRSGGRDRSRTPPRRSRSPRGSPRYEEEKKKSPSRSRSRSLTPER